MTCADFDRLLSHADSPSHWVPPGPAAAHLRDCPRCRELLLWAQTPAPDPACGHDAASRARLLIQADLKPVRPIPATPPALLAALALAAVIALLHSLTMGAAGWAALSSLQASALGSLFLAVVVLAAVSLLASLRPASRRWVPPLLPVLLLPLGFALIVSALFSSHAQAHFFTHGIGCLAGASMIALLTAAVSFSFCRRGYSLDWGLSGALIGAFSGAVALLALQLSCPDHNAAHLLVWHGLASIASIAAGYLAGRRSAAA